MEGLGEGRACRVRDGEGGGGEERGGGVEGKEGGRGIPYEGNNHKIIFGLCSSWTRTRTGGGRG